MFRSAARSAERIGNVRGPMCGDGNVLGEELAGVIALKLIS